MYFENENDFYTEFCKQYFKKYNCIGQGLNRQDILQLINDNVDAENESERVLFDQILDADCLNEWVETVQLDSDWMQYFSYYLEHSPYLLGCTLLEDAGIKITVPVLNILNPEEIGERAIKGRTFCKCKTYNGYIRIWR